MDVYGLIRVVIQFITWIMFIGLNKTGKKKHAQRSDDEDDKIRKY